MLNFTNLNDIEFEYLCKDIMSKMLGVELQRFAPGRDGGVDLADNVFTKNIVVQVKHYIKTDISGLLSSLRKEIPKVEKAKPKNAKGYEAKVLAIFYEMPSQLSKTEKKYKLASISKGARFCEYENAFMWLTEAIK